MSENKEVGEVLTPEVMTENPIEEIVSQEIAKFNLADAVIAQMKEQYQGIEIKGIDDKAGYKIAKEALSVVKKTRTSVEAKRKELKSDYLEIGRRIDGEAKRLTENILEIEEPLAQKIKVIDDEIQAEKERKEREAEEKLKSRVEDLNKEGLNFNGSLYVCGNISVDVVTIKNFTDADYLIFVEKVKIEKARVDKEEAERKEAERIAEEERKAEAQRIEDEKKRQEDERKKLEQERADLEKQKAELEKAKKDAILLQRASRLTSIGATEDSNSLYFIGMSGNISFNKQNISDWSDEEFEAKFKEFGETITEIKTKDEAIKEQQKIDAQKKADEEAKRKADEEKRQKEEQEKAEAERLARLPDFDKIERYVTEINGVSIPQIATTEGGEILAELRNGIKLVIENMNEKIASLK